MEGLLGECVFALCVTSLRVFSRRNVCVQTTEAAAGFIGFLHFVPVMMLGFLQADV